MSETIRFVSCEPLLGPVDLSPWLTAWVRVGKTRMEPVRGPQWVIVGGESGPGARRMNPVWALDIIRECRAAGVPCFMKQAGNVLAREWGCRDRKGGTMEEWPKEFRVRQWPKEFRVRQWPKEMNHA